MTTKNNLPFNIGLFTKSSDGKKAICLVCKEGGKKNSEFALPGGNTKTLVTHLFSKIHKEDSEFVNKYNTLLEGLSNESKPKGQPKIDQIMAISSGNQYDDFNENNIRFRHFVNCG